MTRRDYLTVPDELLELSDAIGDGLELRGYRVSIEPRSLGYPYVPTFVGSRERGRTTLVVEVVREIPLARVDEWVRFAKSSSRDTRVAIGMGADVNRTAREDRYIRDQGVGLYVPLETGSLMEVAPPQDLPMNLQLPNPSAMHSKVRAVLGPAYEQFERSNWREGFGDACQVVEAHSRRYLKKGLASGRINLVSVGKAGIPSSADIDAMTLGQLGAVFRRVQAPNRADATIASALLRLNPDRIGEAHLKSQAATERRLRRNVGRHMWIVADALRALLGVE